MTFCITNPAGLWRRPGLGRRVGFRHQHIAIGQYIQPARVVQAFGDAATWVPAAAVGWVPAGQPMAGAMFTVGIRVLFGSGSCGEGPVPSDTFRVELSPQAARVPASMISKASLVLCMVFSWMSVRVEAPDAAMVQVQGQL